MTTYTNSSSPRQVPIAIVAILKSHLKTPSNMSKASFPTSFIPWFAMPPIIASTNQPHTQVGTGLTGRSGLHVRDHCQLRLFRSGTVSDECGVGFLDLGHVGLREHVRLAVAGEHAF